MAELHETDSSRKRVGIVGDSRFVWSSASVSVAGHVRETNEDCCLEMPEHGLWAVADGMGGHESGALASRMIIDSLSRVSPQEKLSSFVDEVEDTITEVNDKLNAQASLRITPTTIGSTVAALLVRGHVSLSVWAGDSRVYRYRDGELEQITRDHSHTEQLIEQGVLPSDSPDLSATSHIITRAVGGAETVFLDSEVRALRHGDRYLLCTDGLNKQLSDDKIRDGLALGNCAAACSNLINLALKRRCIDNVTAVVVQFRKTAL